jgi:hypothetical protein
MNDNDDVPNGERSPRAARVAMALILIYVIASVTGAWWAA